MIYLDNAATTRISDEVLLSMMPYLTDKYGNASSSHTFGRDIASAIDDARETIADCINAKADEIFFTSSGSEGDNWAIRSLAYAGLSKGKKKIVSSAFEHPAIMRVLELLRNDGFEIILLPVYKNGIVDLSDLKKVLDESSHDVAFVTVMYVNNEIGTIQPIKEIGLMCAEYEVPLHTDAIQAIGNVEIDVQKQSICLLTISGHKIHAPKGIGVLYAKKGYDLIPLIVGGEQERGYRAGTENIAAIIGMSKAMQIATANMAIKNEKINKFSSKIIYNFDKIEKSQFNGDRKNCIGGIVNYSFEGIVGDMLVKTLDCQGIFVSNGSACASNSLHASHVLLSLGLSREMALSNLRISMSEYTTENEIDELIITVSAVVEKLRSMK